MTMTMTTRPCFLQASFPLWIPSALVLGGPPQSQARTTHGFWGKRPTHVQPAQFTVTTPNFELAVQRSPGRGFRFVPNAWLPRVPALATIPCDGWCFGDSVVSPKTGRPDDRWYRLSPTAFDGFEPQAAGAPGYQSPVAGTGWSQTYGSPFHAVDRGYSRADDRHAFDLNLAGDGDAGKPVRPVCAGEVALRDPKYGYVVLKHKLPLKLRNGRSFQPWFSGYMHMVSLTAKASVTLQDQIGQISNVTAAGSVPNHLHFAVYEEGTPGSLYRLKSIDINLLPAEIVSGIARWIDWRGANPLTITGPLPAAALGG
jgi:hypothetical protein